MAGCIQKKLMLLSIIAILIARIFKNKPVIHALMELSTIKKLVLARIKPSAAEYKKCQEASDEFVQKLNAVLSDAKAILGGSRQKDTWLSGNTDIDIFVQFNYRLYAESSDSLSDVLLQALTKAFPRVKITALHGSRDYFQLRYRSLQFEVIPLLKIGKAKDAKNMTDISPLHALWVNAQASKHSAAAKDVKDDIRLLKQLCRAQRIYGAESYIAGFSGYVLEILAIHYGSFENLLKAAASWPNKVVIDHEKYYKNAPDTLFHLNRSKTTSPLIVVDPVDSSRNAAAALGENAFGRFKKLAQAMRSKPSKDLFEYKALSYELLRKQAAQHKGHLVYLEFSLGAGKKDVLGARLVKVLEFLENKLTDFEITESGFDLSEPAKAYYVLKTAQLPKTEIKIGPPLHLIEHVATFRKKYNNFFVLEDRIAASIDVQRPQLAGRVRHLLKDAYITSKVKKIVTARIF